MKIHLRAIRAFLGVPRNACNVGILSEVPWMLPKFRTKIEMIRYYHRLVNMESSRLAKQIFLWDKTLNEKGFVTTFHSEIKATLDQCNLNPCIKFNFNLKDVISKMKSVFHQEQRNYLETECQKMPKLRTFYLFKDFSVDPPYLTKPISFFQRRAIVKTRLGCLPIHLETGRILTQDYQKKSGLVWYAKIP